MTNISNHPTACLALQPGQYFDLNPKKTPGQEELIWCTISAEEQQKCFEWSQQLRRIQQEMSSKNQRQGYQGFSDPSSPNAQIMNPIEHFTLGCYQTSDKDQCMNLLANERVHLVTLDPGEVFWGGRYHSLVPIASERYGLTKEAGYFAVAVVKRESASYIQTLFDLRGKKACFPGVGKMAGWVLPMSLLLDTKILPLRDCNNMVKNAALFFNESCAPNALLDKHNPTGDNPISMCSLCKERCSGSDIYANFDGALRCLAEQGDVAFVKHTTVEMMHKYLSNTRNPIGGGAYSKADFELLCPDGRRSLIDSYRSCNWGFVPSDAVVSLSSVSLEKRKKIQNFLAANAVSFGSMLTTTRNQRFPAGTGSQFSQSPFVTRTNNGNNNNLGNMRLNESDSSSQTFYLFGDKLFVGQTRQSFDSKRPQAQNLLFSDDTVSLQSIPENKQTFSGYLDSYTNYFDKLRTCTIPMARLCVVSEKELEKCSRMRTAFRAQMLKPELSCVPAHDTVECMDNIRLGVADIAMLDAGDIYRAGRSFNLIPILAEKYNLNDTSFYAVAVAKQSDKDTDLLYLKGKRSCHTGFGESAGWVVPVSFLLANGRMRSYGKCNSAKAAAQFFEKSCVPGSLSKRFSHGATWDFGNLCELCHGESYSYCSRDSSEPFHGTTGALRCLVEGDGQIAFTRHTAILENAGKNPSFWSRNVIPSDFELLCRDGNRGKFNDYATCNLARVSANALVTHANRPREHVDAYVNLFLLAQQFYGSKYSEDFTLKMFMSDSEHKDLIFSDATSQVVAIPEDQRHYRRYLGHEFIKSMSFVDCDDSGTFAQVSYYSSAAVTVSSTTCLSLTLIIMATLIKTIKTFSVIDL